MSNCRLESYESAKADFALFRAEEFIPTVDIAPETDESAETEAFPAPRSYPAIILAAGLSRRMGQTKSLLHVGGKPMILRIVDACIESGCVDPITIVTGHDAAKIEEVLSDYSVSYILNSKYAASDMLLSVQIGVRSLAQDCCAFFLFPCDQPLVLATTIKALADCMSNSMPAVVKPTYRGKCGHPVLISSAVIPDILDLDASDTLKSALLQHQDKSIEIEVSDPGILQDIDTPEQYEQLKLREEIYRCEFD